MVIYRNITIIGEIEKKIVIHITRRIMAIGVKKIKIFRIQNRKGYAAICLDHLTEGKTLYEVYGRMLKALKRNRIEVKGSPSDIKELVTSFK